MNLKEKLIEINNEIISISTTGDFLESTFGANLSKIRFNEGGTIYKFIQPCIVQDIPFFVTILFNRADKINEIKLTPEVKNYEEPLDTMKASFAIMRGWLEKQLGEPNKLRENFINFPYCARIEYTQDKIKAEIHQEPVSENIEPGIIRITF